jgi:arylsulfatase A-like enzyme
MRPNVLLIVFDTARADAFEPYGAPPGSSPVVGNLASRGVSANLWLTPASGFATGFDEFVTEDTHRQANLSNDGLRDRLGWGVNCVRARVDDGARAAESALRGWMPRAGDRPFFWFVNLIECHSPYLPPRPYNDLGPVERWRAGEDARRYLTLDAIWRACAGGFDVPDAALERMRHLYRRSVRCLDDWLGRVLEALDAGGLLDDTLVVVLADHGENLGEGGLMGHSFSLDNRLLRVPCVVAGPDAFAPEEAHSLTDLPRLIAAATGIEDHPWNSDSPGGVATAQLDPPAGPDDPRVSRVLESWGLGPEAAARITTPMTSATDGRLKLLRRNGRDELYDLRADPLEETPLEPGAADPGRVAPLQEALAAAARAPGRAVDADALDGGPEISEEERRQLEDRMRLLGYL